MDVTKSRWELTGVAGVATEAYDWAGVTCA